MAKSNSRARVDRGKSDPDRDPPKSRAKALAAAAKPAGPSQRMLRVGEMIRHELAALLARGEIHDETLAAAVITIPEVRMSPDLKLATAYVMPLGGLKIDAVVEALNLHKKYIRTVVAKSVNLKFAPDIRFRQDETFEEASRIDRLLDSPKVRQDTRKA